MKDITFIVPYREKKNLEKFEKKLKKNLGEVEVIGLHGDDYGSFFKVWAEALPKVKTKYVCLTHDDTEYVAIPDLDKYHFGQGIGRLTDNGAEQLIKPVGMLGIAGTTVLHKDQPWWFSKERFLGHILSGQVWNTEEGKENSYSSFGPFGEVVTLDGVCMITTKKILEEVLPTCLEKDYGTWDFYDHILSLEFIKRGYKLLTVPIVLVHASKGGDKRQSFYDSLDKFTKEYLEEKTWRV